MNKDITEFIGTFHLVANFRGGGNRGGRVRHYQPAPSNNTDCNRRPALPNAALTFTGAHGRNAETEQEDNLWILRV
jgi:hypothetical protein